MKMIASFRKGLFFLSFFILNLSILNGQVLYDNGSLINSPGSGVGGADESVLQNVTLGMGTFGLGHQVNFQNIIADDFTVTDSQWDITNICFYAYQTGSTTASTITEVRMQIWDGPPGQVGSNIVFGDLTTNRLVSSSWSNIYRVLETTLGTATNRPIMKNIVSVNTTLTMGTYWLAWQTNGSLGAGPWAPTVTIQGQSTTGNALQSLDNGVSYNAANDGGTNTPQGFPFIIQGNPPPVPTLGQWGLIILSLLMMSFGMVFSMAPKMAVANGQNTPSKVTLQNFAFDKNTFIKMWAMVAAITALGFFTAMNVFGYELTSADPIGGLVTTGIVAYMMTKMKK